MPHLPIHPISPQASDFFVCLFPQVKKKNVLKGKHCANVEEVKQKTAEALKGIKTDKFKNCFEQWEQHFDRCMGSKEEYSEGDWSLNM